MTNKTGMSTLGRCIQDQLSVLSATNRKRTLRPLTKPSGLDLTHNDYLGLRTQDAFQARAHLAASAWPMGAGASRLLGGEQAIYSQVEQKFAAWKGSESALYFSSGFAANEALMTALNHDQASFFSDELNHASIIDGLHMARLKPGQKHIFPHNDLSQLEKMLKNSTAKLKIIITESLFSMDGDFCPAERLQALCQQHQALLVVDEAHALGLYGPAGSGWLPACGLDSKNYISINPCGKAMASAGAFICGPEWLRDYLINTARCFIYSTGPSPWLAAALQESIDTVRGLDTKRAYLQQLSLTIRQGLRAIGFNIEASASHIIPIILGDEATALKAETFCLQRNLQVKAIRPPTVPALSCRLRLSLHANMSQMDSQDLLAIFQELFYAFSSDLYNRHRN